MRRLLAGLLALVMVISPCAVAHALFVKHAGSLKHAGGDTSRSYQATITANAAVSAGHDQHASHHGHGNHHGMSDDPVERGHDGCTGNCETLQRVSASLMPDRMPVLVSSGALDAEPMLGTGTSHAVFTVERGGLRVFEPFVLDRGSKSILRATARMRL